MKKRFALFILIMSCLLVLSQRLHTGRNVFGWYEFGDIVYSLPSKSVGVGNSKQILFSGRFKGRDSNYFCSLDALMPDDWHGEGYESDRATMISLSKDDTRVEITSVLHEPLGGYPTNTFVCKDNIAVWQILQGELDYFRDGESLLGLQLAVFVEGGSINCDATGFADFNLWWIEVALENGESILYQSACG